MANHISVSITCPNLEATIHFGNIFGGNLKGGEVIELSSDLGGGKTTLVKAIAEGAGSNDLVSSPSFTICNQYQTAEFTIYHFDFYRLTEPGIMKRELEEYIDDQKAVVIIEWPGLVEGVLPEYRASIAIDATGDSSRRFNISISDKQKYLIEGLSV